MMKKLMILLLAVMSTFKLFAQNNNFLGATDNDSIILYLMVDELPKFETDDFNNAINYIYSNIQYPIELNISGKVIISFVVTKNGKIEQVRVEKKIFGDIDDEVVRVLLSMPDWKPGKKDGKDVNTLLYLPVDFTIYSIN